MRVRLMACAQSAVIDQGTNAMSIFNIFQEFNAPGFPFAIAGMVVATLFSLDEGEPADDPADVRMQMTLGGRQLADVPMPLQFQGRRNLRHISNIQGVLITTPDDLVVSIYRGDNVLATWPIEIRHVGAPAIENANTQ
jgi:hypothetical protein